MHNCGAAITETHAVVLKEPLTVNINVAADVSAAQRVGDLAGNRFCEEGVVHYDFIRVPGDLLDYTSSFGPPGVRIRRKRMGGEEGIGKMKEKGKRH